MAEDVRRNSHTRWNAARVREIRDWLRVLWSGTFPATDPRDLGRLGEKLACRELVRRGYTILETRARCRVGEIDIVARDGKFLVFVEVKTRRGDFYGHPSEAVGWRKQKKLIRLARAYAARKRLSAMVFRFDVVGVEMGTDRKPRIEVLQGAFQEV